MSLPVAAWRTSIAEVMEGAIGEIRTVTAAKYVGDVFEGQPAQAQKARALQTSAGRHRFDVRIRGIKRHGATTQNRFGTSRILQIAVEVLVTSKLATSAQATQRDADVALVMADCELAVEALSFPGNLRATDAGDLTGIIGAVMRGPNGEAQPRIVPVSQDWARQLMTTRVAGELVARAEEIAEGSLIQDGSAFYLIQDGTGFQVVADA